MTDGMTIEVYGTFKIPAPKLITNMAINGMRLLQM